MAAPLILSGAITSNNYMLVTFDQGVYTTAAHITPITSSDFTITFTKETGTATNCTLSGTVTKANGTALSATGGESVVRIYLTWTGMPNGNETIRITVASGSAVYNVTGQAMAAGQNTGDINAYAGVLNIYVSKAGNDLNDGFTPATAKLTIGGANNAAMIQPGYSKIWIGIGTYVENPSIGTINKYVTAYGDYDGTVFGSAAGTIQITESSSPGRTYTKELSYIKLAKSTTSLAFIKDSGTRPIAIDVLTFNNCIFDYTNNSTIMISQASQYAFKAAFNNCSAIGAGTNPYWCYQSGLAIDKIGYFTRVALNNCDFYTNMTNGFLWLNGMHDWTNGTKFKMAAGQYICSETVSISMDGCTWNSTYSTSISLDSKTIDVGGVPHLTRVGANGHRLFMNNMTTVNMGSFYEFWNNASVNPLSPSYNSQDVWDAEYYYRVQEEYKIHMYNMDSDGLRYLMSPFACLIRQETVQHNDNDVITFKPGKTASSQLEYLIPIKVVAGNTYTLTFDFKVKATTTASRAALFGILRSIHRPKSSSTVGYTYNSVDPVSDFEVYSFANFTTDTWYDGRTLNFTAVDDIYYFHVGISANLGANNEISITYPVLTID